MAIDEQLELEFHPIWERQPNEPDDKYLNFERYFLPLPRANLTGAYRRYLEDQGDKGREIDDANGQWKRDCDRYRWRQRHVSFWRWKNQSDSQWREEKIREYQAESLDTASLLRFRAMEILENFAVEDASPKDAVQMLRLATELTESSLNIGDLDKAYSKLISAGYEVTGGEMEQETTTV